MIPKLVVTAALMLAETALTMSKTIKGPRLDELKVSVADYGTPMPRFWGIRRFECPIIWAEDLKEVKTTSKTKSGKYKGYKYYGTFAVLIADQEIDAVTRIWADKNLVYDTTKSGPISVAALLGGDSASTGPIKLTSGKNMRVYTGTETQTVDPRYQTWCEDRYGADSAPPYRGVSYIVFEDIPLEKFGNRIPQVTVEAVSVKSASYPFQLVTTQQTATSGFSFSPSGQWMAMATSNGLLEWWDAPSRTRIGFSDAPGAAVGSVAAPALANDGTAYFYGLVFPSSKRFWTVSPLGAVSYVVHDAPSFGVDCVRVLESDDTRYVYGASDGGWAGYLSYSTHIAHSQVARDFCIDEDGQPWILFQPSGASSDFTIETPDGLTTHTFTGTARSGPTTAYICKVAEYGHFIVVTDGDYYIIDATTWTVTASGSETFGSAIPLNNAEANPNLSTLWYFSTGDSTFKQYSLDDFSLLQSVAVSNWTSPVSGGKWAYDASSHAMWTHQTGNTPTVKVLYLDRITSAGVTLQTVVDDVCGWCGLTDKDTSALTQAIDGFSVTQGSGKDMIDPLLSIHDVDARPHDFEVQFVNRGSSPSGTILTADFVRDGSEDRYKVTIRQDTDLPKKVTFNFADKDKDQQTNTAIAQRPLDAVDSQREEQIDLSTYVATVDEAQQFADRYFRRVWNSREAIENAVTAQHLGLEPGDVTTVSLDGTSRNVRLDKMTISQGRINCTFVRDETSFAAKNSATTGAVMDGRDDETIQVPAPVRGFVIDAPLAQDSDSDVNPLLYTGAGPYGELTFTGAAILRGDDGSYDELFAGVTSAATWGIATEALADVNSPWLWDRGNTLNVSLESGSLTSATEADIDADPTLNLIAVGSVSGWEYLNFTTATLEADGTYTLSGFKRGRRGTEWMTGSHATGDSWVLVSSLTDEQMGTDDVGDSLSFKCQSVGRLIDTAPAIDLTYTGATLKPYAPARIDWTTDGTDMTGTIIRRTRVGGSYPSAGWSIPLSENSEEYEVDILDGSGNVLRTITVTGTNVFTYANAQISADGNTVGVPPSCNAYQLSDAVGRGFALAA